MRARKDKLLQNHRLITHSPLCFFLSSFSSPLWTYHTFCSLLLSLFPFFSFVDLSPVLLSSSFYLPFLLLCGLVTRSPLPFFLPSLSSPLWSYHTFFSLLLSTFLFFSFVDLSHFLLSPSFSLLFLLLCGLITHSPLSSFLPSLSSPLWTYHTFFSLLLSTFLFFSFVDLSHFLLSPSFSLLFLLLCGLITHSPLSSFLPSLSSPLWTYHTFCSLLLSLFPFFSYVDLSHFLLSLSFLLLCGVITRSPLSFFLPSLSSPYKGEEREGSNRKVLSTSKT